MNNDRIREVIKEINGMERANYWFPILSKSWIRGALLYVCVSASSKQIENGIVDSLSDLLHDETLVMIKNHARFMTHIDTLQVLVDGELDNELSQTENDRRLLMAIRPRIKNIKIEFTLNNMEEKDDKSQ